VHLPIISAPAQLPLIGAPRVLRVVAPPEHPAVLRGQEEQPRQAQPEPLSAPPVRKRSLRDSLHQSAESLRW